LLALEQKIKIFGSFIFHFDHFKDALGFVALGMGFVVKIGLRTGIWTNVGLGNGICPPPLPSGPSNKDRM